MYLRDAFGPLPAFLYGWTSFFVISSGSIATLAVAFSNYLSQLIALSPIAARATSIALIVLLTAINVRGTRKSATVQNWTTGAKVGVLTLLSLALIVIGRSPTAASPSSVPVSTTRSLAHRNRSGDDRRTVGV